MSEHERQDHDGYEKPDADAGGDATGPASTSSATMFRDGAASWSRSYRLLARPGGAAAAAAGDGRSRADPSRRPPPSRGSSTSEPAALAEFRAQEDASSTSYGWVEKDRGIARMPIDEAMRIVAERGRCRRSRPAAPAPAPPGRRRRREARR